MILQLGNIAPIHDDLAGSTDEHITYVDFPDGITVPEAFITVTDPSGVWTAQSTAAPSWVACSDPDLEAQLCAFFNCSPLAVPGLNA